MALSENSPADRPFSVAVICDTQNYVDHRSQVEAGFPLNAREILWDMMAYIARNSRARGGDIVFATGLGDSWQHPSSSEPDARFAAQGAASNPVLEHILPARPRELLEIEIPAVREAYRTLDGVLPFSVVPGNHDHDHLWTDANLPPTSTDISRPVAEIANQLGGLHVAQLRNWVQTFGSGSDFFRDKEWYVSSFRDGRSSAQIFEGGGYRFLHLGLEMAPDDSVIDWARSVLQEHAGLPTILSIHEYLNSQGERRAIDALDLTRLEPERNSPQQLWEKLIAPNDQIFMTLNGHFHGVQQRIDRNDHGNKVWQFLVNYQSRRRALHAAAPGTAVMDGIGDGWLRLLTFDLAGVTPRVRLRAYSTFWKAFASDLPGYAEWYRDEHPDMDPEALVALDECEITLDDFRARFGEPTDAQDSPVSITGAA